MNKILEKINESEAIVIGAGAGLSTSAGFKYSGDRFKKYFFDFINKYHFTDMYSGGFYDFESKEEYWAYWSRYIYINRYMDIPKDTYNKLYNLVKDKNYFVITTNVDHCFQKAGFDKDRLFYTQGDYGLFQCIEPCHNETYDNYEVIKKMLLNQGFSFDGDGLIVNQNIKMTIDSNLIPHCPICGKEMTMNLRSDSTFVEDDTWHIHSNKYFNFLQKYKDKDILYLELGVGYNTPVIIKYPFWQLTYKNPKANYISINLGYNAIPREIVKQSICINSDINEILTKLQ